MHAKDMQSLHILFNLNTIQIHRILLEKNASFSGGKAQEKPSCTNCAQPHLESSPLLNQLCNPGDNSWEANRTPLQQGLQTSAHGDEKRCCYDLLGELQLSLLHPLLALTAKLSLRTNKRVKIYLNKTARTTTKAKSLVCERWVLCFTFH